MDGFDQRAGYTGSIVVEADLEAGGSASQSAHGNLNRNQVGIGGGSEWIRYPSLKGEIRSALGDGVAKDAEESGTADRRRYCLQRG